MTTNDEQYVDISFSGTPIVSTMEDELGLRVTPTWIKRADDSWVLRVKASVFDTKPPAVNRELVNLDPNDIGKITELLEIYMSMFGNGKPVHQLQIANMQRTLKKLVKPPEPLGLGAVVRARCGCSNIRSRFVYDPMISKFSHLGEDKPWKSECGHHSFDTLDHVEILSSGTR